MSYVRIVDIELVGGERFNDTLELRINEAIYKEHPITPVNITVMDVEKIPELDVVRYKVLILFKGRGE
jgi:hypothetical protein